MKNSDMPAMPQSGFSNSMGDTFVSEECGGFGLTKREYFAAMAMQGMLAHATRYKPRQGASSNWHEAISEESCQIADALLAELEKKS